MPPGNRGRAGTILYPIYSNVAASYSMFQGSSLSQLEAVERSSARMYVFRNPVKQVED